MLLAATEFTERHLPMPPILYGLVALAILLFLLVATFAIGKGRPDRR